ncbi:MAG: SAM-dependent chlorinase/fluorinase [Bacteroidota bacterium]
MKRFFASRPSYAPIALLTDFGSEDSYVGTMKGVIASLHPDVRTIDICHSVSRQNVREAAYLLWSSYPFFPQGTVFVVVVDPGVGTDRRILLLRIASRWFLAPDNGVLDFVVGDQVVESATSIALENSRYILSPLSNTFHGRDVFAPIGAFVSLGVPPEEFGKKSDVPLPQNKFVSAKRARFASILHIDRFGNIITDVRPTPKNLPKGLSISGKSIRRWVRTYEEAPSGSPCLIIGSSGLLEVCVKNDHAAKKLKARTGSPIRVLWA